ncbi:hypothetical protein DFP72DRAFT_1013133 [Ephemerocybe angulata]|uniref:BTB domain-containing protein n=1 Tax=Ephemerocybe angulata TaxID=980116 RepID=A0A8H6M3B0_9AGAR|nr:hypothetical protein DFP72DRAFT_1013133 [Tulosesus angulatus]
MASERHKRLPHPEPTVATFMWDIVVFKVEGRIFQVPRQRFIEYSDIFADMFGLPASRDSQGKADVEGLSIESPITLDGYRASEFEALLKAMYPTSSNVLEGAFRMTRDEWISVLKLSTVWNMKKIRQHAITGLSSGHDSVILTSVDKAYLGLVHRVAPWLVEGITSIISSGDPPSLSEIRTLGLSAVSHIVLIQAQASPFKDLSSTSTGVTCSLGSLKCPECYQAFFENPLFCDSCSAMISLDNRRAIYLENAPSVRAATIPQAEVESPHATKFDLWVDGRMTRCAKCLYDPIPLSHVWFCRVCDVKKVPQKIVIGVRESIQDLVMEAFHEELEDCRQADMG